MLNFKNNENDDDVFDEICKKKKAKIKIKFHKMKGTFFRQHLLVEKSPTTTDWYIYITRKSDSSTSLFFVEFKIRTYYLKNIQWL